jgi:hypothetical protein
VTQLGVTLISGKRTGWRSRSLRPIGLTDPLFRDTSLRGKFNRWKACREAACYGVTLTLLNCEVLSVVVLPLATARPM